MIIIAPYAQKLRTGGVNPKNYPHWEDLIKLVNEPIVQVGITGEKQLVDDFRTNLPISELKALLKECRTWIGVDSFFQHLGWIENKKGIVLWGPSDPLIFGHPENVNLLKDRSYLVQNQYIWWEQQEYLAERFVEPNEVIKYL